MNPVADIVVRHVAFEINAVPVFFVEMVSTFHGIVSVAQVFRIVRIAFHGDIRLFEIERQKGKHLVLDFKDEGYIVEREGFRYILQRQTVFAGFFYIHTVDLLSCLFARSVECVVDMIDPVTVFSFHQSDDVEADRQVEIEIADIGVGRCNDTPDLFSIDGIFGGDEEIGRPCLDFGNDQLTVFYGDNIQFVMMPPPIGMQHTIALALQVLSRQCFSFFSQFVSFRHWFYPM